jgi:hypothetical protein
MRHCADIFASQIWDLFFARGFRLRSNVVPYVYDVTGTNMHTGPAGTPMYRCIGFFIAQYIHLTAGV